MHLSYDHYLDKILGGWIGKSIGGAVGARFEGNKGWIEISPDAMFPPQVPPNDDLDLQVLWLKVLEEKGNALTSDDLAQAWLDGCWYPFNEYGIFRRNWQLGIYPPLSGRFANQFWESGMGSPIRAEIWGYVFPGAPDLAARYAEKDAVLDHTDQSVGGEKMLAAMASMAFFVPDMRRLADMFLHYLPAGTPIQRLTLAAFQAYDDGLSLRDAHDRLMLLAGHPEACDSQINVPFTFLGLLYGQNDLQATLLSALNCGYDTDCTMATAGALVGQILGASRIPAALKDPIGDELVMGIEYRRDQMTLSALARDTARMGILLSQSLATGVHIDDAPPVAPLPASAAVPPVRLDVTYHALPAAAPGQSITVHVAVEGRLSQPAALSLDAPAGWRILPETALIDSLRRQAAFTLNAPASPEAWPMRNHFTARLDTPDPVSYTFGVVGAGLWMFLGAYYEPVPDPDDPVQMQRVFNHHFVDFDKAYLPEPHVDVVDLYRRWSHKLGQPALIPSYENEIDLSRLIGLRGPYCAYLHRTVISPVERPAYIVIGNTDSYRLYLNDELVGDCDEHVWWTPFNNVHPVTLRQGHNRLLLKLLRRDESMRFTLAFRARTGLHGHHHNMEDWLVDLADLVPG